MKKFVLATLILLLTGKFSFSQINKPEPLRLMYATINATVSHLWVAKEAGIFRKNNLDVEILYGAQRTIESLIAGEIALVEIAGPVPIAARLAGADIVLLTASINAFPFSFVVSPEIGSYEKLKGKVLGVTRFGASSDVALRMSLQKVGIDPNGDVRIIQAGGFQELYAAMEKGAISGALFGPPILTLLKTKGFRELMDLRTLGIETQHTGLVARRAFVKDRADTVRRFVESYVEGIHRLKTDKEFSLKVISKNTKVTNRDVLEEAYNFYALKYIRSVPTPSLAGVKTILEQLALKNPKAETANPEDFVDFRFVNELEKSGFIAKLYKHP